mmetsp:Transcript_14592/g.17265  ORF Transcript_14592/g.17265 Transcript_14592/m.17265 type:complete len:296 (+) Transcript_14592:67-954(+)
MMLFQSVALLLLAPVAHAYEDTCMPFHEIYKDGTELCEVMWNNAFEVKDDDKAYTMWFFDAENNPNDAITRALDGDYAEPDDCRLNYFHKDVPSPEGDGMKECHPWKNNACCHSDTVGSVDKINEAYGEGYEWNRCGEMSQACERFFVAEACFYECEPAAGLYRKYNESDVKDEVEGFNEWQIEKMPIKRSFCDAWYTACHNDYFCGKGDFFECQAHYVENQKLTVEKEKNATEALKQKLAAEEDKDRSNTGLIVGLAIAGSVALIGIVLAVVLAVKEKSGAPVFAPSKPAGNMS